MKLTRTLLFLSSIVAIITLSLSDSFTNSSQAPTGRTGAPGELTCNSAGCHDGNNTIQFTGPGILSSQSGATAAPTAGTTYNMSFNAGSAAEYGFSLTALDDQGNAAGTLELIANSTITSLATAGGKQYVGHLNANGTVAWPFKWTVPAVVPSVVYFYIAANLANNDGSKDGDQIYTYIYQWNGGGLTKRSSAVPTNTGIALNADDAREVSIYPNPVKEDLSVFFDLQDNAQVTADIYNINGQLVKTLVDETLAAGAHARNFTVASELSTGMYLVKLNINNQPYFKKIMVE